MAIVQLTRRERRELERMIETGPGGREVRRAQALIWLHEGVSVQEVARRTRLTRQAIYALVGRYQKRHGQPMETRIGDRARSGRPATKLNHALKVLGPLLQASPQQYGYRAACWTVPMLKVQVDKLAQMSASPDLIRRALKGLRYRYKRPRFVLS